MVLRWIKAFALTHIFIWIKTTTYRKLERRGSVLTSLHSLNCLHFLTCLHSLTCLLSLTCLHSLTFLHSLTCLRPLTCLHSLNLIVVAQGLDDAGVLLQQEVVPVGQVLALHLGVARDDVAAEVELIVGVSEQGRVTCGKDQNISRR